MLSRQIFDRTDECVSTRRNNKILRSSHKIPAINHAWRVSTMVNQSAIKHRTAIDKLTKFSYLQGRFFLCLSVLFQTQLVVYPAPPWILLYPESALCKPLHLSETEAPNSCIRLIRPQTKRIESRQFVLYLCHD